MATFSLTFLLGNGSSTADEFIANNMSLSADCSEDDLINITFELCNTEETGTFDTNLQLYPSGN